MANVRGSLRFIAVLALLSGCSLGAVPGVGAGDGGTDSGSGSSDDTAASTAFDSTIKPIVARCSTGTTCHVAPSLQNPQLASFATLKMSAMINPLYLKKGATNAFITKAATLGAPNMHPVGNTLAIMYLSTDEQATFSTFMDMYGTP